MFGLLRGRSMLRKDVQNPLAYSLVDMGTDLFEDEPLLASEGLVDLRAYMIGDACNLCLENFAYSSDLFRF